MNPFGHWEADKQQYEQTDIKRLRNHQLNLVGNYKQLTVNVFLIT